MEWVTDKRAGTQTGVLFVLALIVLDFFFIGLLFSQPIGPLTFLMVVLVLASIPLAGWIAYQLFGLARSGYDLDRTSLTIQWGAIRQIVPTESIQRILLGTELEGGVSKFRGSRWPGLMSGHGELPEAGLTLFYASSPLKNQLVIVTPALSYAISPVDAAGFIESIKARYELGPTQAVAQRTEHPAFFDWPLWRDRLAYGLVIAGAALWFALFGLVTFRYPDLPATLPMHYTINGLVDRTGSTSQAFILPLIGAVTVIGNTLLGGLFYRREQMAAYVLWGGMILVQILLWIGAVNLLRA